jgi:hypothetical protein
LYLLRTDSHHVPGFFIVANFLNTENGTGEYWKAIPVFNLQRVARMAD